MRGRGCGRWWTAWRTGGKAWFPNQAITFNGVSISDLTKHCHAVLEMVQRSNKPMLILKNGRALAQIVPVEGAMLLGVTVNLNRLSK